MRLRRVGPGIGGLYYSPLLQDARSLESIPARPESAAPVQADARPSSGRVQALWAATVRLARRMADRFVEARMAQARRHIEMATTVYRYDGTGRSRDAIGSRYY